MNDDKETQLQTHLLGAEKGTEEEEKEELKLLLVPSVLSGIFLGITNFSQGTISDMGIGATFLYSNGALITGFGYIIYTAIQQRKATGEWWSVKSSNLVKLEEGKYKVKWEVFWCLLARTIITLAQTASALVAFHTSDEAGLN